MLTYMYKDWTKPIAEYLKQSISFGPYATVSIFLIRHYTRKIDNNIFSYSRLVLKKKQKYFRSDKLFIARVGKVLLFFLEKQVRGGFV